VELPITQVPYPQQGPKDGDVKVGGYYKPKGESPGFPGGGG